MRNKVADKPPMSSSDRLSAVAESAGATFTADGACGERCVFWQSTMELARAHKYRAASARGLHLGAGVARTQWTSTEFGSSGTDGPALVVMESGHDETEIETVVQPGRAISCGLLFAHTDLNSFDNDPIGDGLALIRDALDGSPIKVLPGALGEIEALNRPFCPALAGTARRLMIDARAFTLVALTASAVSPREAPPIRVTARGRHFAIAAREVLDARLDAPPTMSELAREVGLNPRSLSSAFHTAFGMSVGAYLAERRMSRAVELLEAGLTVASVAYRIGYSPAAFSTAFRRRYGRRPSDLRRPG